MKQSITREYGSGLPNKFGVQLSRRTLLLSAASLPAIMMATPSFAQSGGLLDPSQMGRSTSSASALTSAAGVRPSDGNARSWFVAIADSLQSLFAKVRAEGGEHSKLSSNEQNLRDQVAQSERDKEAKLDEFRNGLFCSGCNQTRSEIWAKGETFPHAGQSIIKATAEQIAAKERELNAAINRLKSSLDAVAERVKTAFENLQEAFDQIQSGCGLFSTALYNWKSTIVSHEHDLSADFVRERDAVFAAASEVTDRGVKSTSLQEVRSALSDLDMWEDIVRKLNASMTADWNASQAALTDMHTLARARHDRLMAEGDRITHALGVTAVSSGFTAAYYHLLKGAGPEVSPGRFGGDGLEGLRFRLGDASPSRRGEILANVQSFVDSYRSKSYALEFRFSRPPDFESDPFWRERRSLEIREQELS